MLQYIFLLNSCAKAIRHTSVKAFLAKQSRNCPSSIVACSIGNQDTYSITKFHTKTYIVYEGFKEPRRDSLNSHKRGVHNIRGMAHNCGNCEPGFFFKSSARVCVAIVRKRTWLAMSLQHEFPISHILTLSPCRHLQIEGEREGNKDYMQIKNFTPVKAFKKGHDVKKLEKFPLCIFLILFRISIQCCAVKTLARLTYR